MTTQRRDLVVGVDMESERFERKSKSAAASASVFERELRKQEAAQKRVDDSLAQVGRGMVVAGVALATGAALSARAAIQWESDWAGVAKTLSDATVPQLDALEGQLRGLARELPQSHSEIAQVAAAAGQLGIKATDIAEFTRTMVDLGVATNLTSEQAAFAIARIGNIMGTLDREGTAGVRRLGSAIVELGNNSATTEADIVEMALRISGAGKTIGLTEAEVLGFATALSSVGIEAQAGGTAISRVMVEIANQVRSGGENLEQFAETAGMSSQEFVQAFERDPAGAIQAFVAGLGRVDSAGGNVFETLDQLSLSDIRVRDALLRMSGAGDILARSLEIGNRGWDENIALAEEAERRYGTVEARMQIARGQVEDLAISLGQGLLPVVGEGADMLGNLAETVNELPGPLKGAVGVVAALAAGITLTGGAALIAVPKIAEYRAAVELLGNSSGRMAGAVTAGAMAMSRVTSFLFGPWGIALAAGGALLSAFALGQSDAKARAEEFSSTLDEQTGAITDNTRALAAHKLEESGALETAQRYGIELSTLVDAVLGNADAQQLLTDKAREHARVTEVQGQGITTVTGDAIDLRDQVFGLADDVDRARESQQRQNEATGQATEEVKQLTPEVEGLKDTFGLTADEAESLSDEISRLDEELQALFDATFGLQQAKDELTTSFRQLREQVKTATEEEDKNATALTGNSEAAINNRRAIEDLIERHGEVITKMIENGSTAQDVTDRTNKFREKLIETAEQLGINVEDLDNYLGVVDDIPSLVETSITADTSRARLEVAGFTTWVNEQTAAVHIVGRGFAGSFQHGGPVPGPSFPPDRVPIMATGGEFMVRREVAQPNMAALEFANRTGARLMVAGGPGGSAAGTGGAGSTYVIENMHAWTDRFSLPQIHDEFANHGVS